MTLPLIVGNWKMHGVAANLDEARALANALRVARAIARVAICAPATLVDRLRHAVAGSDIVVGGQDIRAEESGAFTGDISAEMLADAGARIVIVGHSERRAAYGETGADVCRKAAAAIRAGLRPIICVGESLAERAAGRASATIAKQISESVPPGFAGKDFVVAYEPVWAVGSTRTPAREDIEQAHRAIRAQLRDSHGIATDAIQLLYGGSVTSTNAAEILGVEGVDGVLVGAASLHAESLLAIVRAAPQRARRATDQPTVRGIS